MSRADDAVAFVVREDAGGLERRGVRLAGSQFLREQLPVKADGALPLIEEWMGSRAKAARPHFGGLVLGGDVRS